MHITSPRQMVAAIALIRDGKGNILIQKRNDLTIPDAHSKWEFPGGGVEYGESPEQTLRRECKEEIGCEVKIERLLPRVYTNYWKKSDGSSFQVILVCYLCSIVAGTPLPSNDEVSEIRWCAPDEVMQLPMLPGNAEFIKLLSLSRVY